MDSGPKKVLIIDDDAPIRDTVQLSLGFQKEAFEIRAAQDGETGLEAFLRWQPDIVVLDIMLPKMSGLDVLARIRKVSNARVIMLSAKGRDADIAKALEAGADDYVTKPFSVLELTARIRSQARRTDQTVAANGTQATVFAAGDLKIDFRTHDVFIANRRIKLSETEYQLLAQLIQNADRLLSYRMLLQLVWGSENYKNDVVRVYVSRLRKKIEESNRSGIQIITKPGIGYMLKLPGHEAPVDGQSNLDGATTPGRDGALRDSPARDGAMRDGPARDGAARSTPLPSDRASATVGSQSRWSNQRTPASARRRVP